MRHFEVIIIFIHRRRYKSDKERQICPPIALHKSLRSRLLSSDRLILIYVKAVTGNLDNKTIYFKKIVVDGMPMNILVPVLRMLKYI